jgi:hypothetical protein
MNSLWLNIRIFGWTTLCNPKTCAEAAGIKSPSDPCTYLYRKGRHLALGQKQIKIRLKCPKFHAYEKLRVPQGRLPQQEFFKKRKRRVLYYS